MRRPLFETGILLVAFALVVPSAIAQVAPLPGEIVINEFVATNQNGLIDKNGDHEDWLELRNTSAKLLDLSNVYLTDATDNLLRWKRYTGLRRLPGGHSQRKGRSFGNGTSH